DRGIFFGCNRACFGFQSLRNRAETDLVANHPLARRSPASVSRSDRSYIGPTTDNIQSLLTSSAAHHHNSERPERTSHKALKLLWGAPNHQNRLHLGRATALIEDVEGPLPWSAAS